MDYRKEIGKTAKFIKTSRIWETHTYVLDENISNPQFVRLAKESGLTKIKDNWEFDFDGGLSDIESDPKWNSIEKILKNNDAKTTVTIENEGLDYRQTIPLKIIFIAKHPDSDRDVRAVYNHVENL